MNQFALLCLDNNPVTIEQLHRELRAFASRFDLHIVDNIDDANAALDYCLEQKQAVALVIASHHENFNGAGFLIQLDKMPHTQQARKILISCGQDIQAILSAVNNGRLDHCLTKPLQDNLVSKTVQKELTTFILKNDPDDLLAYSQILDHQRLLHAHIDNKMRTYRDGFISEHHKLSDQELAQQVTDALLDFFSDFDETKACRTYSADHLLTREGEENHFLWFITQGEVALYKKDDVSMQREVVRYSQGNIVGGMSFVTGEPSFSTAITLTQTKVIKLDRDVFAEVMHSNTALLPLFTNLLLRHFNRRLQRSITTKLQLQKTLESLESTQKQLIEHEKMAMLGQLIAGVAHELNNPVSAILSSSQTLTQKVQKLIEDPTIVKSELSLKTLNQALTTNPRSTSDEREQVKQLSTTITQPRIAKKLVKLNLADKPAWLARTKKNDPSLMQDLETLEDYYLVGSTLRSINVCTLRIADMVKSLKGYSRENDERFRYVDIHEGIEDTLIIFENKLKFHKVETHYCSTSSVYCLPIALQQVWANIISNAIDAFPTKGLLIICTELKQDKQQQWFVVTFEDNGVGIPIELQQKIFELNFTTKKEGNFGLGIGLSVCQQIVRQHGGFISVDSEPHQYTKMSVWLPLEHPKP